MVQISALVTLLAMGSSIMATPVGMSGSLGADFGVDVQGFDVNVLPRDNGASANLGTSLAKAGGRGGGGGGDMAGAIIDIATNVGKLLWNISNDIEARKAFTQDTARDVAARFPGYTVVVCNVGYRLSGSGWQQVTGVTFKASVGRPVTFDVVVFKSPKTFERQGDGGFQNWAYIPGPGCSGNGGTVSCR